jgi:hypothetical protein
MENQKKKQEAKKEPVVRATLSPFRNLANYKQMHAERAKDKGKYEEFMSAPNLTRARKVLG